MIAALALRLARLEQAHAGTGGAAGPVILMRFVSADGTNPTVQSAACGVRTYLRAKGEAEDAFRCRMASGVEGGPADPERFSRA